MSETEYPDPISSTSAAVPAAPAFPVIAPGAFPTTAPAATPAQVRLAAPSRVVGKTRRLWAVWLLQFTLIYPLIWYFKINKELRDFDPDIDVQPGVAVLAVTLGAVLLFIPPIVSYTHTTSRIQKAQKLAGSQARCSVLVALLCGLVSFGSVYVQSQLNKAWAQYGNPRARTAIA